MISPAATAALRHVRALGMPGTVPDAPITVNFHPDRLLADGRTVAACLAGEGVYRSQFETRISNGGLLAYPGGDRDRWEHRMFGGAYSGVEGRPIYGALNLAGHPDGAAPRFGSCHLVLEPGTLRRATFCHGDSHPQPSVVGTADAFGAIRRALHDQVIGGGEALGVRASSPAEWEAAVAARRASAGAPGSGSSGGSGRVPTAADGARPGTTDPALGNRARPGPIDPALGDGARPGTTDPIGALACGRTLDDYVEAQLHGGLALRAHVTAVVADPSFMGTDTAAHLASLGLPVRWHAGFALPAAEFPADLRGPDVPPLAREIAERYRRPVLDAEVIGRAARAAAGDPGRLQQIKYLWHILVLRGRPFSGP
ncbi:DUF3626 domain-containing protein [Actinoplanes sp. NPDC023714]|uniref:DUF3626 domain-containing protein n=1 Tax=Actinoplanes sp. NPDC023714 TaxID=3154322 RepID=UPI0033D4939C